MLGAPTASRFPYRLVVLNTAARYSGTFISMGVTFLLTPFLVHTLGRELLGLQTLAGQALQFLGLVSAAMGISYSRSATVHHARREFTEMNGTLGAAFWLSLITATLFACGTLLVAAFAKQFFGLSEAITPTARMVILITGLTSSLQILTGVWTTPFYVSQRLYWNDIAGSIATVGAAVAVVIAFKGGHPSIVLWAALANGFRLATTFFLLIPLARRTVPEFKPKLGLAGIVLRCRGVMGFGFFAFLGGLGYLLYYSTDSILISNLGGLGTGRIIEYNLGQRWDPMIRMFISGFAGTLTPVLTSLVASGEHGRLHRTLVAATRYSLALALFPCLVLVVYSGPFIACWVGRDFAGSAPIMRLVLAGTALSIPSIVGYEVLVAHARIGLAVSSTLVGGVLNIALAIFFVKVLHLGLMGLALAVFITMACRNAIYTPMLLIRISGLSVRSYFVEGHLPALLGAVPFVGLALALRFAWEPRSLWGISLHFGICGLAYLACVWYIMLTLDDRVRLAEFVRGARKKCRLLVLGQAAS
jgi:O-antigen/teichoic acid export membrane protein